MRDHRKLRAFEAADQAIMRVYRLQYPTEERYGLQSQIRRAAVSVATNIVEGSARRSSKEYLQFLQIAFGSAAEVRYLADLSKRLDCDPEQSDLVEKEYGALLGTLIGLIRSVQEFDQ